MSKRKKTSISIDQDLWTELKVHAIRKHVELSDLLEKMMREELGKPGGPTPKRG